MTPAEPNLAERLGEVRAGIAQLAKAAGRDPSEITLIVVTKFQPASLVLELAHLGIRDVGENRHQEAVLKHAEIAASGDLLAQQLRWHFIGQLQSNKARSVRQYASAIHSIDRQSLLAALSLPEPPIDVFIQVNLTDDPARGGVLPVNLASFVESVLAEESVRLRGLMAVAGLEEDPAREFAFVRNLRDSVVLPLAPDASALSMGMSGDWEEAVREGATHLRIGSAITGNRPAAA